MGGLGLSAPQFCGMLRANTSYVYILFDLYQSICLSNCFSIRRSSELTQSVFFVLTWHFCVEVSAGLQTRAGRSPGLSEAIHYSVIT